MPFLFALTLDTLPMAHALQYLTLDEDRLGRLCLLFVFLMSIFILGHRLGTLAIGGLARGGFVRAYARAADVPVYLVLALMLLGLFIGYLQIAAVGGLDFWSSDIARRTFVVESTPFTSGVMHFTLFFSTLWLLYKAVLFRNPVYFIVFLLALLAACVVIGFLGGRVRVVFLLVACLLAYNCWSTRGLPKSVALLGCLCVVVYFLAVGSVR